MKKVLFFLISLIAVKAFGTTNCDSVLQKGKAELAAKIVELQKIAPDEASNEQIVNIALGKTDKLTLSPTSKTVMGLAYGFIPVFKTMYTEPLYEYAGDRFKHSLNYVKTEIHWPDYIWEFLIAFVAFVCGGFIAANPKSELKPMAFLFLGVLFFMFFLFGPERGDFPISPIAIASAWLMAIFMIGVWVGAARKSVHQQS